MADKLKAGLAKGEEDRLKAFKTMMAEIQKRIKEIETYVKNKLKEFSDAHADMSEELKKELAKYVNDLVNATKKLTGDIQARQKERNAGVADLLAEATNLLEVFKTEREKMAASWRVLTTTMAKKKGIIPKVEAEVKVRPVKEVVEEVPPEISLEDRVLEFIERHPEGVRVTDMEEALGVPRQRLGKIAKTLLNKDKVRKEENLYFPLKRIKK
jgi:gas vesicle protein